MPGDPEPGDPTVGRGPPAAGLGPGLGPAAKGRPAPGDPMAGLGPPAAKLGPGLGPAAEGPAAGLLTEGSTMVAISTGGRVLAVLFAGAHSGYRSGGLRTHGY